MKTMLTTHDLAERWSMNPKTIEQWRGKRIGPPCVRIGGKKILYRMKDILEYEKKNEVHNKQVRADSDVLSGEQQAQV